MAAPRDAVSGHAYGHALSPSRLQFYWLDRIAFFLLLFVVLLRALVLRRPVRLSPRPAMWPMAGLLLLGLAAFWSSPTTPQNWSVFAAKWVVPFALYHLAGSVFDDPASLRRLRDLRAGGAGIFVL